MNPNRGLVSAAASICFMLVLALGAAGTPLGGASPGTAGVGAIVRTSLTKPELGARQRVQFALRMRNFAELETRIARGEVLSLSEMRARYLPTPEAYAAVSDWARSNGYSVEGPDSANMTVFTTSTVKLCFRRAPAARWIISSEAGLEKV